MKVRDKIAYAALPGLAAVAAVAPQVTPGIALGAGIVATTLLGNPYQKYVGRIATHLQTGALIGLGANVKWETLTTTGLSGIGYTAVGVASTLVLGKVLGRHLDKTQRTLIDAGTAICGGSAINAVGNALGLKVDKDQRVAIAFSTVFLLNSISLYFFPEIGKALGMSEKAFGQWVGSSTHDTASALGAAEVYGPEALKTAALIKSTRALWITPLALFLSFKNSSKETTKRAEPQEIPPVDKIKVFLKDAWKVTPGFIVGFLGAAVLVNAVPGLQSLGELAYFLSKHAMTLMLFLVGTKMNLSGLLEEGRHPLLHGVCLWALVAGLNLAAIQMGLIQ